MLAALGIPTPIDLKRADPRLIRERFNVVLERTVYELRGVSCLGLEEVTPDRKSIMASRSFGQPVYTRREMEEAVGSYTARAAEKMRRQNLVTAQIVVFIHTNRFRPQDRSEAHTSELQSLMRTSYAVFCLKKKKTCD